MLLVQLLLIEYTRALSKRGQHDQHAGSLFLLQSDLYMQCFALAAQFCKRRQHTPVDNTRCWMGILGGNFGAPDICSSAQTDLSLAVAELQ